MSSELESDHVRPLRVAFETLGCRSNYADTVELQTALLDRGAVPCQGNESADVYVVNTCSVTDAADKAAYRILKQIKKISPTARVVVTGCLAEVGHEELSALGIADAIIGPGRKQEVLAAICNKAADDHLLSADPMRQHGQESSQAELKRRKSRYAASLNEPMSPALTGPGKKLGSVSNRSRYHLRVQEGCENSCTFCIIPQTRGGFVSRPAQLLLDDVQQLSELGYQEVVLTGTHLGGYGVDIGTSLLELLERLERQSPITRIRLSSIDPNDLTPEIVELIGKSNVFCRHLHICVQAFCDQTLKRMNRRYRLSDIYAHMELISRVLPGCCVGSDLITGFPGESRSDVEAGMLVFEELPFSYLHVFPYSERSGTAATRLDGAIERGERKRRSARWRALAERRKKDFHCSWIGRTLQVVLEEMAGDTFLGTSREYASVQVPLSISTSHAALSVGMMVNVEAESYDETSGRLVCVY